MVKVWFDSSLTRGFAEVVQGLGWFCAMGLCGGFGIVLCGGFAWLVCMKVTLHGGTYADIAC